MALAFTTSGRPLPGYGRSTMFEIIGIAVVVVAVASLFSHGEVTVRETPDRVLTP